MCLHLTLITFPCSVKQHIMNTMFSGINMAVCMVYNWLKKIKKKRRTKQGKEEKMNKTNTHTQTA